MPIAQRIHFGGAAGLATGLHNVGDLVIDLEKRERTARPTAAAELFFAGTNRGQVSPGARAVLEEHRFAVGQLHDRLHVVVHRLDEAGAALRVFVLSFGPFGSSGLGTVIPVTSRRIVTYTVLVIESHVEPHGRIERAILIEAKPRQLIVKNLALLLAEVTVADAPVRNRSADSVD